uniref:Uncharacterized protein n=1 Tax=Candidatus Kentrum sp. TUN TaxID=2126343 RepID=A0A450ZLV7_9GAMM|nr:MAG: hypothetical protein BECKTUN1418F_GA0071002_105411 [Candidatus Kentron sp. TUN]VFK59605.1 MAG: hypothetical protein BECKTUN1418E_GA0071001_105411 [Candidatus Kentron sp. TUN]
MKKLGFLAILFLFPVLSAYTNDSPESCHRMLERQIKDTYGIETLERYKGDTCERR